MNNNKGDKMLPELTKQEKATLEVIRQALKNNPNIQDYIDYDVIKESPYVDSSLMEQFRDYTVPETTTKTTKTTKTTITKPININGLEIFNKEYEPIDWIVEDLIGEGLITLAGEAKVGKTTLVLWLLLKIARQEEFIGFQTGKERKTLFIALENSERSLQDTFLHQGYTEECFTNIDFMLLFTEDTVKERLSRIEDFADEYKFIIIDTLESFAPGLDHNDSKQIKPLYQKLFNICKEKKCTILVTDHPNKSIYNKEASPWSMIRGSTSKTNAVDQIIVITEENDGEYKLHTKGRDVEQRELVLEKDYDVKGWKLKASVGKKIIKQVTKEDELLEVISELGTEATTVNIAKRLGRDYGNISRDLKKLNEKGTILKGTSQKSPWYINQQEEIPF